jgi:hypothetical protein
VNKILKHPDHNHLRLFNLQIDGVTVRENINAGSSGWGAARSEVSDQDGLINAVPDLEVKAR